MPIRLAVLYASNCDANVMEWVYLSTDEYDKSGQMGVAVIQVI